MQLCLELKYLNLFLIALLLAFLTSEKAFADESFNSPSGNSSCVIGVLVTHNKTVLIKSSDAGPVFSIQSNEGKTLAVDLTIKELIVRYPDLNQTLTKGFAGDDARLYLPSSPMESSRF
ncbi:hypothetical protein KJ966_03490 [bacterium]|nr:hypothetical protein [bacterium]